MEKHFQDIYKWLRKLQDTVDRMANKESSGGSTAGLVPDTRTISTTAPLTGGGDLSANRTLSTSMNTNKLIGRGTAGAGVMEEITLGTNLSLTGTTLNATSGSSGLTQAQVLARTR